MMRFVMLALALGLLVLAVLFGNIVSIASAALAVGIWSLYIIDRKRGES